VSRENAVDFIVHVLAPYGHGEFGLLKGQVVRADADDRPRRQHIVERCQQISIAAQEQREVLRMALDGRQQPERELGEDERAHIVGCMVREEQQNFDAMGHYARPDVLQLKVNQERQRAVRIRDEGARLSC
jgi:hypothetical protein